MSRSPAMVALLTGLLQGAVSAAEDEAYFSLDGSGAEQVTNAPGYDGGAFFSRDGKKLVLASSRNNEVPGETNVFIADWLEEFFAEDR
jgi:hypothetical protein